MYQSNSSLTKIKYNIINILIIGFVLCFINEMKSDEYKILRYLSTKYSCRIIDVMLSHVETLRRSGKLELHE